MLLVWSVAYISLYHSQTRNHSYLCVHSCSPNSSWAQNKILQICYVVCFL